MFNTTYLEIDNLSKELDLFNSKHKNLTEFIQSFYFHIDKQINAQDINKKVTELLKLKKLIKFSNDSCNLFFYYLKYDQNKEAFSSLKEYDKFYKTKLCNLNFPFNGIIAFEISEWVDKDNYEDERFLAFLGYLYSNRKDILYLFYDSSNANKSKKCFEIVNRIFSSKRIEINKIDTKYGLAYVKYHVKSNNFTLSEEAIPYLSEMVSELINSCENNIYGTIDSFVKALLRFSISSQNNNELNLELLTKFKEKVFKPKSNNSSLLNTIIGD